MGALATKFGWGTAALIQETMLCVCAMLVILAINPKLQLSVKHKLAGGH
jgi:hypothetical protein